jgi:hypothetical protein
MDRPPVASQRSIVDRIGILRPLRLRDFRLLWIGSTVSFIGDGIYVVAMALQVLELSNRAGTLAYVGIAWATPQVVLSLVSGALSDRIDRRRMMIAGDLIRLVAMSAIGLLSIFGILNIPVLVALVVVFGVGQASFGPSFSAITPSIVPAHLLVEANGLGQFVRPVALLMIGPLFGGLLVAAFGPGWAFIIDGATFAWSAVMIFAMTVRTSTRTGASVNAVWQEMKEGLRYVLGNRWLAVAMFGATISLFVVWGPWETLVPFIVKNDLVADPADEGLFLGLVFGAGGVGALLAGLVMGQRSTLPRKPILVLYASWALGMFMTAGFGIVTEVWQAMIVSFVAEGSIGVLLVIWFTLLQRLVPTDMLGRVTSLDWMITLAGVPLSFAVVGPAADAFGADAVMIWAGAIGGLITIAFLLVPGARDPERDGSLTVTDPSRVGG